MISYTMPEDLLVGCATASYQVEGCLDRDGREPSIWDDFCKVPGAVYEGQDGSVADEHYVRYEEDISLMAALGFKAYRFSISWPRIISYGKVNGAGISHYRNMIECIRKHGMKAVATLYHWDLPQSLERQGGWLSRETAYAFQKYAETCFLAFGDIVDKWITLNEPWCSAYLGYGNGVHAPGKKGRYFEAVHNLLLAHGLAVMTFRAMKCKESMIGIALNPALPKAASSTPADQSAAEVARVMQTDIFLEPLMNGKYPKLLTDYFNIKFPSVEGDMEIIKSPIDFIGMNYYCENTVASDEKAEFLFSDVPSWQEKTAMGWPVTPYGLLRLLRYFQNKCKGLPIYITENGAAYEDVVEDGAVHDLKRCAYLQKHIEICKMAIDEKINLKGYFVWSFMDNFEWSNGYSKRFGIVYVDYKTQQRIIKDSGYMMKDFINNAVEY